jgi:ribosomal protein L31E
MSKKRIPLPIRNALSSHTPRTNRADYAIGEIRWTICRRTV